VVDTSRHVGEGYVDLVGGKAGE